METEEFFSTDNIQKKRDLSAEGLQAEQESCPAEELSEEISMQELPVYVEEDRSEPVRRPKKAKKPKKAKEPGKAKKPAETPLGEATGSPIDNTAKKRGKDNTAKKHGRWILPVAILALLLGLVIALFIRLYTIGDGKISNVTCVLEGFHLSCIGGHDLGEANCLHGQICSVCGAETGEAGEHDWSKATCVTLSTCSVCGKTTGTYADHVWQEATCTEPETCSVCGKTQGEALGHTLAIGTCARCGEEIGRDIVTELDGFIAAIEENDTAAVSLVNAGAQSGDTTSVYSDFSGAKSLFAGDAESYGGAIAACADYEELADLKTLLASAQNALPLSEPGGTIISQQSYLNSVRSYLNYFNELTAWPEKLEELFTAG